MANAREALLQVDGHLSESMGVRPSDLRTARLSPKPRPQDLGRRLTTGFGRIDVDKIIPDPQQPRAEFTEEAIERLAASIRDQGQLTPIRVRWSEDHGRWMIIAGERRWRATKRAGLATIECYFHEEDLTRTKILEQQLIENLLREDLKPIEEAHAYADLMSLNQWTGKQVAAALRVPASKVSRSLALLRLPENVQGQVNAGEIAMRTAYELSRLPDNSERSNLIANAAEGTLTHSQAVDVVRGKSRTRKLKSTRTNGIRLTFPCDGSWQVLVQSPHRGTYFDVELALQLALDEVRHRIQNNVQLF